MPTAATAVAAATSPKLLPPAGAAADCWAMLDSSGIIVVLQVSVVGAPSVVRSATYPAARRATLPRWPA